MFLKKNFLILVLLIGATFAGDVDVDSDERDHDDSDSAEAPAQTNSKREAAISSGYGVPEETEPAHESPAPIYGPPSAPQSYSKSIPAAAIRNVETVAVTKTITPVVTKTTTYHSHAEPALSIGHVQGYQQTATGQPKIAPVQFQTQYTSYSNPTVGVNGPVTYTGPAVVLSSGGGLVSMPISALAGTGSLSSVYGPPSTQSQSSGGALPSTYGPPGQSAGTPLGAYSKSVPRYVSFRPVASPHTLSLQNIQQLQQLRAPSPPRYQQAAGSQISPMSIRATRLSPLSGSSPLSSASSPSPYAIYQLRRPLSYSNNPRSSSLQGAATSYAPLSLALRSAQAYQPRPQLQAYQPQAQAYQPQAQAYQPQAQTYQAYQPQNFAYLQQPYLQQQQSHPQQGPLGQPTVQYVQTYTMPSVSYTRLQPANKQQQLLQQQQSAQSSSYSPQYQLRAIRQQVN